MARTLNVSDGDNIESELEGISNGETINIPNGSYSLSDTITISADNFTVKGQGATFKTTGRIEIIIDGSNWSFGNVKIEPQNGSDPNVWCQVRMPGGVGWRFHNVAWTRKNLTQYEPGNNQRMSCILPGVDNGGECFIEECWFGEGCDPEHGTSAIATWDTCDGTVWIRRSYFYQSGVYGANSSTDYIRNEGVTHYEDCYFENIYLACMRTGSHYEDAYVRRCVTTISDINDVPTREGIDGHYSRGIYAYHGPVIVENCHLDMDEDRALDVSEQHDIRRQPTIEMNGGELTGRIKNEQYVTLNDVGSNPRTSPPSACVTSISEAVSGSGGSEPTQMLDVTEGEDITSQIESISDGDNVGIPTGNYKISSFDLNASNFSFDAQGSVLHPQGFPAVANISGSDWQFGGFKIDNSSNTEMRFFPEGANWRLHRLGWINERSYSNYLIYPVCDTGSSCYLEDIYFNGVVDGEVASSAIFVYADTDGIVNINRCWFDQQGVYGIDSQRPPEMEGVTRYRDCFFRDGYISCLRTGSPYGLDGLVARCTFVYSDDETRTPDASWDDNSNVGSGRNWRCVWGWWGHVDVVDCDMKNPHGGAIVAYGGISTYNNRAALKSMMVKNCRIDGNPDIAADNGVVSTENVSGNPDTTPPAQCPASPAEAMAGGSSADYSELSDSYDPYTGTGSGSGSGGYNEGSDPSQPDSSITQVRTLVGVPSSV